MFRDCPIAISRPLPFAINDMDFLRWFKSLTRVDDAKDCEQFLHVLLTLNKTTAPSKIKLLILEKLTPVIFQLTARLTSQATSTANIAFDNDENIVFSISIWSCAEIANNYKALSVEDCFKKNAYYSQQQKSLIITHGIQALGRALLYMSQLYSPPYANFWADCFHFYRLAHHNETISYNGEIITNAFKQILVFYLSHTNQFSPQDMRVIYTLLGQYSVHAQLLKHVPEKKFNGIPYIHLRQDLPPNTPDDSINKDDPYLLHIATVGVSSRILDAVYDKELEHSYVDQLMLLRLAKALTSNTARKHKRTPSNDQCLAMINFEHLVDYLRNTQLENTYAAESKKYFERKGSGILHKISITADTDIPITTTLQASPTITWNRTVPKNTNNAKLIDKSRYGCGLIWSNKRIKPKVGNIIGLQQKNLKIGLIRWLSQSEETDIVLGVELLGINAQAIKICNPSHPDMEIDAIYLPQLDTVKQPESVLVLNNGFHPDTIIFIKKEHQNHPYRQMRQLSSTAFLNRYQIVQMH